MKQTLTVTTKGQVYWSVEVDRAGDSPDSEHEDTAFRVMAMRAERLRTTLNNLARSKPPDQGRRIGEIVS